MRRSLLLIGSLLVFGSGCGAIRSTVGIVEAEKALKTAHELGAKELAPFPTTLAEELLDKAREEAGYAEYSRSWELATEAKTLAESAAVQARENPVTPPTRMVPLPGRQDEEPAAAEPAAAEPAAAEPAAAEPAAEEPAAAEPAAAEPAPAEEPGPVDEPAPAEEPATEPAPAEEPTP